MKITIRTTPLIVTIDSHWQRASGGDLLTVISMRDTEPSTEAQFRQGNWSRWHFRFGARLVMQACAVICHVRVME
jgi:hypothetical protein